MPGYNVKIPSEFIITLNNKDYKGVVPVNLAGNSSPIMESIKAFATGKIKEKENIKNFRKLQIYSIKDRRNNKKKSVTIGLIKRKIVKDMYLIC